MQEDNASGIYAEKGAGAGSGALRPRWRTLRAKQIHGNGLQRDADKYSYRSAEDHAVDLNFRLFFDFQAEVAAVVAPAQRFRAMPEKSGMQAGIADIVAVAEAAAQLWAAILHAGIVIRTFCHVDTPCIAVRPQLGQGEACRRAEGSPC